MNQQQIDHFKELHLKLVEIPVGSKGPVRHHWNTSPISYKKLSKLLPDINVGVIHGSCSTCCFDIDDLKSALSIPLLKKHIIGKGGLEYSSGVENKLKCLFKLPKGKWGDVSLKKVFKTHNLPGGCGQFRCGSGAQDVLPGSVHPSGSVYSWSNGEESVSSIPLLPKVIIDLMVKEYKIIRRARRRGDNAVSGDSSYPFINVYNKWFMHKDTASGDSLLEHIFKLGGYEYVGMSDCVLKRIGSTNTQSVVIYNDSDGIDRAFNFSDTIGPGLLEYGLHDPYSVLSLTMGFDSARSWVCKHPEMKTLIDSANDSTVSKRVDIGPDNGVLPPKLRLDGILFQEGKKHRPYLDMSIMIPHRLGSNSSGKITGFGRLVKSILFHQQGVYNPDMAFWYSLSFADYLIGGGYGSIGGNSCEPLYVFTAGNSGDGKSVTLASGATHLAAIGASGNAVADAIDPGDTGSREDGGKFISAFLNKRHVKNVKTAEGLEDLVTCDLSHGCDILFTQDEYGLKEGGIMDGAARSFRSLILDWKTLMRNGHVEPRLLSRGGKKSKASSIGEDGKLIVERGENTYCVHFNYFTTATNETLKGVIRDAEVGQGYIQRFVGGCSRSPWFKTRYSVFGSRSVVGNSGSLIGKKLRSLISSVIQVSGTVTGYARALPGGYVPVAITSAADLYLNQLHDVCIESCDPLVTKLVENMQPIAKLYAIFENPKVPVVDLDAVQWAHTICSSSVLYFRWLLNKLRDTGKSLDLRCEEAILSWLANTANGGLGAASLDTGVKRADVIRGSRVNNIAPAVIYGPVWDSLLSIGVIVCADNATSAGRKSCVYYLSEG